MECNFFIKDGILRGKKNKNTNTTDPQNFKVTLLTLDRRRVLDLGLQKLKVHELQLQ